MSGSERVGLSLAIVVNSREDNRFEQFRAKFLSRMDFEPEQTVRVSDARSMSEGYNRGCRQTASEWVLFVHDDIELLTPRLSRVLERAMRNADVIGVCGTQRLTSGNWYDAGIPSNCGSIVQPDPLDGRFHRYDRFGHHRSAVVRGVQALDGVFIMVRRTVFDALGGFDQVNYSDFHTYDIDFSFRSHLAGFRCVVVRDLLLHHRSAVAEYSASKLALWQQGQQRFVDLYGHQLDGREAGLRTHESTRVEHPEDAIVVAHYLRRRFLQY